MLMLYGLHEAPLPVTSTKAEADAVVAALNAHNDRVFKVTIVSTAVVATAALVNAWRTYRQLQRDEALFRQHLKRK